MTMPAAWQRRFNASSVEVRPRMDDPIDPAILDELRSRFPDFVRAYEPDGLTPDEFDAFGPSARTLRAFVGSYHELLHQVGRRARPEPGSRDPVVTEVATNLYRPVGSLAADGWSVVLTPESAGWRFSGLRVGALEPGGSLAFDTGADEVAVLPLEGAFDVVADGERYGLAGRTSVWAGPSDFLYAPPGTAIHVESAAGGRFAVTTARAEPRYPVRHVPASAVGIEMRGAGRQLPRGPQLREAGRVRCGPAHRGRSPHPGRQLGLVSAPQAR